MQAALVENGARLDVILGAAALGEAGQQRLQQVLGGGTPATREAGGGPQRPGASAESLRLRECHIEQGLGRSRAPREVAANARHLAPDPVLTAGFDALE